MYFDVDSFDVKRRVLVDGPSDFGVDRVLVRDFGVLDWNKNLEIGHTRSFKDIWGQSWLVLYLFYCFFADKTSTICKTMKIKLNEISNVIKNS